VVGFLKQAYVNEHVPYLYSIFAEQISDNAKPHLDVLEEVALLLSGSSRSKTLSFFKNNFSSQEIDDELASCEVLYCTSIDIIYIEMYTNNTVYMTKYFCSYQFKRGSTKDYLIFFSVSPSS
jgi:hypothetical protein